MSVQAYLNFNGNCREAVEFYAEAFGTEKPRILSFGEMPSNDGFPLTEETKNLVMHAELKIMGSTVMFSDAPPDMPFIAGNNISLIITSSDMEEIKATFHKLKVGGTVVMDLQETFWSKCYGFIIDQFGIGWQLSYDGQKH
ncbi:VOC family protein [Sinanaerobacter chloroacetimidivorans]|uniref:Glyoxalase/bleomycin resistance/extradiol dioxygenase family protein n=1 Tax=Sinanaerobacter chloroacetimidivorans TaxID=2818044 RepID=A0A8J7W2W7_9FIRM|nr:glyoxalase/bleomycin resistance/extradiol dioxygenase family protein [Sinanaerobacter chloroacetimidivorans]MBR0599391.1 glyoxalase/bleomycin resistance/extradiol dioxygenase family protein [Sinanaerobacter chloroacetimidivorans]